MIKEYLKKDHLNKNIQPDEAIAIGATIVGKQYEDYELTNENDLVIADVVPLSLGVKIENDLMDIIIKKNTPIPCIFEKTFETCIPFQEKVDICIYEGENKYIKNNFFLDEFQLTIKNPKKKNYLPIIFEINSNDYLLKVNANILGENNSGNITIKRVKRNENEINEMINKGIEERKREEEYEKKKKNNDIYEETMNIINVNIKDSNNSENISIKKGKRNEEMINKEIEERKREEEYEKKKK